MNFLSVPFMRDALVVSLLAGNALAFLGLFVVMRRVAFSGLAVAQLAALGAVIGLLFTDHSYFVIALLLVWAGFFFLAKTERWRALPRESWVGTLYIIGGAFAILILSKAPLGESHTLSIFFGNILALGEKEIWESLLLFITTGVILGPWLFRWIWITFDPQSVEVGGLKLKRWDFMFYALVGINMTVAIHLFGVLLAFAYLLLPASISLLITGRLRTLVLFIPLITTIGTLVSFHFSFQQDLPTGPFIAAFLAILVLAAAIKKAILWK